MRVGIARSDPQRGMEKDIDVLHTDILTCTIPDDKFVAN